MSSSMAELSSDPIPSYLIEAFHQVVRFCSDWRPPEPEREVTIKGTFYTMSEVCGLLSTCSVRLPADIFDQLYVVYMDASHTHLREKLDAERSYAAGAYCLLKLIDDRKADYRRREEWPGNI